MSRGFYRPFSGVILSPLGLARPHRSVVKTPALARSLLSLPQLADPPSLIRSFTPSLFLLKFAGYFAHFDILVCICNSTSTHLRAVKLRLTFFAQRPARMGKNSATEYVYYFINFPCKEKNKSEIFFRRKITTW